MITTILDKLENIRINKAVGFFRFKRSISVLSSSMTVVLSSMKVLTGTEFSQSRG